MAVLSRGSNGGDCGAGSDASEDASPGGASGKVSVTGLALTTRHLSGFSWGPLTQDTGRGSRCLFERQVVLLS